MSAAPPSPLEQFHPDGRAGRVLVVGAGRIGVTLPSTTSDSDRIDLLVIVPTNKQARTRGWLEAVLAAARPRLDADAVVYVVVSRFHRLRIRRQLERQGLRPVLTVAHVPDVDHSRYLVPIDRATIRRALESLVAVWPRRRRVLAALLRLPGTSPLLAILLRSVAVVAQAPAARLPFEWLTQLSVADVGAPVVMTSGRLDDRLILLSLAGAEGANVAKVRGSSAELEQEGINLGALGPAARTRVARLPELRALEELDGRSVLVETAVPGIPAAALLASHPGSFAEVVALLAEWLEAWHRATVVRRKPESGELDRYVLSPAKVVAAAIPDGARYLSWLTKRCRELEGTAVPFVPAHDDLTMFNVLVDDGRLGVVDWEAAAEGHLPLTDFVYAVVDAAAATAHYDDRLRAFVQCFFSDSDLARLVTGQQLRLVSALEIPAEVAELSFHACWIRHAANELSRRAGDERAFLPIVERLAAELPAWQNG